MSRRLDSRYGIRPHFKYVATTQNLANLISRGLTLKKFMSSLEFLYHGPSFLHDGIHHWLTQNLLRLSRQQEFAKGIPSGSPWEVIAPPDPCYQSFPGLEGVDPL